MISQPNTLLQRSEFTLGILAGGSGRRVGYRDKGLLVGSGQTLVERTVSQNRAMFAEVIVCCHDNPWFYSMLADRVFCDSQPGLGPLMGIAALLAGTETEFLAVIPCDQQSLPAGWLDHMFEAMDSSLLGVYASQSGRHTACCLLRRGARPRVEKLLENKERSLGALFEQPEFSGVEAASMGCDIDYLSDLRSETSAAP